MCESLVKSALKCTHIYQYLDKLQKKLKSFVRIHLFIRLYYYKPTKTVL
jgi:hypothetical protein